MNKLGLTTLHINALGYPIRKQSLYNSEVFTTTNQFPSIWNLLPCIIKYAQDKKLGFRV